MAYGVREEVPIGSLAGKVVMKENGRPLPNALVTLEPIYKGEDVDTPVRIHRAETDSEGRFRLGNVRSADYLLTITGDAHEMSRESVHVGEGKMTETTYRLAPINPYLDLYASQHVFTPEESPKFQIKGFSPKGGNIAFRAFKLDMKQVLAYGNLESALSPLARPDYRTGKLGDPRKIGSEVDSWEKQPGRDIEGVFVESIGGQKREEGLYWIQAKCDGMVAGTWLMITRIALVAKRYGTDAVAFVTDIQTGKPIQGADLVVNKLQPEPIGKTGADGSLRFVLPGQTVYATYGKSQAFVDLYRGSETDDPLRIVTYTDRPIYRPGDTAEFKGIVRKLVGRDYVVPAIAPVKVELRDENDDSLGVLKLTTSAMGTFAGKFELSKELGPGYYSLVSTYGDQEQRQGISVAAYRKPTYSISVTPEKTGYVRGDRVRMKVKAEYYFGGPVPNAEVEAYVYRSEFFDPSVYGDDYADAWGSEGGGYGGDYVTDVTNLRTDENGEAWVEFDTKPEKDDTSESDFVYSVNVSVVDEGGKYFDGDGSVKVLRGEFSLAVDSDRWVVDPGKPFTAVVRAARPDGKSVAGTKVDLTSGIEFWNGEDMEFLKPERQTVELDARGMATVQFTPSRAGSYTVRAVAHDPRGNAIGSSLYVWADGTVDPNAFEPTKLDLTLDKRQYKVGETAKAVIRCGAPGGAALVTIEADKLYEVKVVPLDKPAVSVELPVTAQHAPNVFVDVAYVQAKTFSQTERTLRVDDPQRKLKIDIQSDRQTYKPGDVATYTITTTTEAGAPTSAEVSLGVVDESIYAIAEDSTDLLSEFYPRRYNRVETQYSFPDLYLDGDKAPTSVQVRRKFKDTAFWAPMVTTDPTGHATVTVPLPDNLTTWRATAYGITTRTEVGKAVSKVLARRDLMVRLEAPAFMVGQDRQRLAAVVTNDTGADATVNVELTVTNAGVEGELRQKLTVPKGGTKSVEWTMLPKVAGEAAFVAKAWIDGGASDGVEAKVPVLPHGRSLKERNAGAIDGSGSIIVTKRPTADEAVGRLSISVTPTIAPALEQSLDELIDFPYGCVEQTMSRFLPTVTVAQALQAGGYVRLKRSSEIPAMVADGLARLYRMQHGTGAWGWWEYDSDSTFMTAYVLDGLRRARQAGFRVDDQRISRAVEWGKKQLALPLPAIQPATSKWEKEYFEEQRRREIYERSYLAYSLASEGALDPVRKWFASHPPKTGPLVAAYAALAASAMGEDPASALASLAAQAIVTGAVASWKETYWGVETTGRCFDALIRLQPESPLVDKVARGLMEKRRGRIWWSTRDTSFALLGMARYVVKTKELNQSGQIQVKLNGQPVGTVDATTYRAKLDVPIASLKSGENKVEFVGVGVKRLYYAVELDQVEVSEDIPAAPVEGLSVERRYYKLSTQRFEDGSVKFAPGKEPVTTANAGDIIQVQITLRNSKIREYVLVEDPLPAGCVVSEREDVSSSEDWTWWWDKIQIYDDRVALFVGYLPQGDKVMTYTIRVENPGLSTALPTLVSNMYDPDAVASSAGAKLEVRPK